MNVRTTLKIFIASAAFLVTTFSYGQEGLGGNTIGFGAKLGVPLEMENIGMLNGYEMYYKTGNWQFELFRAETSGDIAKPFSTSIEEDNVYAGGIEQGDITDMLVTAESMGFNVRWFFSGSTNIGFGYSQYAVNVDYGLLSSDSTEIYENTISAQTSALHVSFGNQWKLYDYSYFGVDWVSSIIPSKVEASS
jgi:hypothetical protein